MAIQLLQVAVTWRAWQPGLRPRVPTVGCSPWRAAWTIGIGSAVLAGPRWALEVFYHHNTAAEERLLWMTTGDFGLGVLLFGLGYALVAIDPDRNRGFVQLGVLGKVLVVLGMIQRFVSGVATR